MAVARVVIANPFQVTRYAYAHVNTDKIDARVLATLHAAGFPTEVWTPPPETERLRRLVARRKLVRHCTRIENEVHSIHHASRTTVSACRFEGRLANTPRRLDCERHL
jgi:transposase